MRETPSKNQQEHLLPIHLLRQTNVVHVSCGQDATVLLAFRVRVITLGEEMYAEWYDTSHIRRFRVGRILKNTENEFSFERGDRESQSVYRLSPLTLDTYNREVKDSLLFPREFETEEELLTALRAAHISDL